jgi:exonuclease III
MRFTPDANLILKYEPDVLIIQECEYLAPGDFSNFESHWIGQNRKKGLAILTKFQSKFESALHNEELFYFLPISSGDTLIVGVWAFNSRAQKFGANARGFIREALEIYKPHIGNFKNVIVAGDFNNGPKWDRKGNQNNFSDINLELNNLGLRSAYHSFTEEYFGSERASTHFHKWDKAKGFHIDYIYSNFDQINNVKVPDFDEWERISDHVPVIAEFENM